MYKYNPLGKEPPQIRLVTIETAASATQAIRLRLTHVELNSHLKYHTLSYTWGSPGPQFPACWGDDTREIIYVDGQEFPVRLNLHAALVQLRDDYDGTIGFWIDAICVDQSDIDERTSQVALMAQIYSGTQCNVTWLGPSDDGTEAAFRLIERLSTTELLFPDLRQPRQDTDRELQTAAEVLQREFGVDEVYAEWTALASVLGRHYWQRSK